MRPGILINISAELVSPCSIVQPVSGMNITGNMLELWQRLVGAANDADPWETELIPSLMFEGVHFAGN